MQPIEKRPRGIPKRLDVDMLLRFEGLWVDTFRGLRDGNPEFDTEAMAGGGMFIKHSSAGSMFINRRIPGPEQLYILNAGKEPRTIRQSKFDTTDEKRHWRSRAKKEEDQFEEANTTSRPMKVTAIRSERRLWEALKRADTAAKVRRICSRSKIWLKPGRGVSGRGCS